MKETLLVSSFSTARPCTDLRIKNFYSLPNYEYHKKERGGTKIEPLTLATSSRSLLARASTVRGIIVAEATALAAYQTKNVQNSELTAPFDLRVEIACFIVQLVRPAWVI